MSFQQVEIFEFSTGLKPVKTADGKWISGGFTGGFMNNSFPNGEIPSAIERAIANREFSLPESSLDSNSTFCVIGRLIQQAEHEHWSVLSVISKGEDNHGRFLTLYRYYAVQDPGNAVGNLCILEWLKERIKNKHKIIFDPFDIPTLNNRSYFSGVIDHVNRDFLDHIVNAQGALIQEKSGVLLLDYQFDFQRNKNFFENCAVIHAIATYQCKKGSPMAWGYSITNLEKPSSFGVIHAANAQTIQLLANRISDLDRMMSTSDVDEQAIKAALKRLMNRRNSEMEDVDLFESYRLDKGIPIAFWEKLFDAEGASKAISQGIYNQQMLRLLLLQMRFLPDRMIKTIQWMQKCSKENLGSCQEFVNLYSKYANQFTLFDELEGINVCLAGLMTNRLAPEDFIWLIISDASFWKGEKKFIIYTYRDIEILKQDTISETRLSKNIFWEPYLRIVRQNYQTTQSYSPFLKVLKILRSLNPDFNKWDIFSIIFAVFTQIVVGHVASPEFKTAFPNAGFTKTNGKLFNVVIRRKMTKSEEAQIALINALEELGGIAQDFFRSKYFKLGVLLVSILAILYTILIAVSAVLSNPFVNRYLDSFGRLLNNPAESSLAQGETSELSDSPSLGLEESSNHSELMPPTSLPTPAPEERLYDLSPDPDLLALDPSNPEINQYGLINLKSLQELIQQIRDATRNSDFPQNVIEDILFTELASSRPDSLNLTGDRNLLKLEIAEEQLMIKSRARLIQAIRAYEIEYGEGRQFSGTIGVIDNLDSPLAIQLKCATAQRLPDISPDVIERLGCQGDE
jgi:hypothetical protein